MSTTRFVAAALAAVSLLGQAQATFWELPACTTPFQPYVYSGCFQDTNTSTALIYRSNLDFNTLTAEKCVAECKGNGYRYAGLEYYGQCFCGQTVNVASQLDESQCTFPCNGNKTQTCGGSRKMSIYQDPTFKVKDNTTISDYVSLGCWTDNAAGLRALNTLQSSVTGDTLTTEKCLQTCKDGGFPFAGTEYGRECWCGVVIGNGTAVAPDSACNMPCKGNSSQTCGGSSRLNLYVAKDLLSLEPCGYVPPSSSSVIVSTATSSSSSVSSSASTSIAPSATSTSSIESTSTTVSSSSSTASIDFTTSTSSAEVSTSSDEATTTSVEPTTSSDEATTTSAEPTTSSDEATTISAEPTTSSGEATTTSAEPTTSSDEDTTTSAEPTTSSDETTTSAEPSTTSSSDKTTTTSSTSSSTSSSSAVVGPTSSSTLITSKTTTSTVYTPPPTSSTKGMVTTTSSSVCTTTTVIPPSCEYKCGNWCSSPLPDWNDQTGCQSGHSSCAIQIAACFKTAGWPGSMTCFDFSAWCSDVKSYCKASGSKSKSDCVRRNPPKGDSKPTTSTIIVPCKATSTTVKTTTSTKCPIPTPTGICAQPSNKKWGYSVGDPVGGIELAVVTCNDLKGDFSKNPFKVYTDSDSSKCASFSRSSVPSACASACKAQYDQCTDTYAKGCQENQQNGKSWGWGISTDSSSSSALGSIWGFLSGLFGRDTSYFEYASSSESKKRTIGWSDSYKTANSKCQAQYSDCLSVNKGVNGNGKCGSWGSGW